MLTHSKHRGKETHTHRQASTLPARDTERVGEGEREREEKQRQIYR